MNYEVTNKELVVYDDEGNIAQKATGIEFAYLTADKKGLLYLCNSFGQFRGDLYYIKNSDIYNSSLLSKKIRIIDFSSDFSRIVFLEDYSDNSYEGKLCIIEHLQKKLILDTNVYQAPILIIDGQVKGYKVLYTKRRKIGWKVYSDIYLKSENENKIILAEGVDDFKLYNRTDYDISMIFFIPNNIDNWDIGNLFKYEDGEIKKIASKVDNHFTINNDYTQLIYIKNISSEKADLIVESLIGKNKITLIKDFNLNIINSIINTFGDIFKTNGKRGDYINFEILKNKYNAEIHKEIIANYHKTFVKKLTITNLDNSDYKVYFRKKYGKKFNISCELADKGTMHKILDNIYPNDDSENHLAIFNKNQKKDLALLLCQLDTFIITDTTLLGQSIYGADIEDIIEGCTTPNGWGEVNGHYLRGLLFREPSYRLYIESIIEQLLKLFKLDFKKQLGNKLSELYSPIQLENQKSLDVYKEIRNKDKNGYRELKKQIKEVENEMILTNKLNIKWKSEVELFKLVRTRFNSATIHASPSWLERQHLDIYVEDCKIAFEYQGKQHYQPIKYFGGEDSFKKRLELDKKKRGLCKKNNVTLIEWRYDEPITKANLEKKLRALKI